MANTTNHTHRSLAVLALPKRIDILISYATGVVMAMTSNPVFPSPSPALATVMAAIADLMAAETEAVARGPGAAATRDAKKAVLVTLLRSLRLHVQLVAYANGQDAPAIIQAAGMAVKETAVLRTRSFGAFAGAVPGTVKLVARSASYRASYDWQYSTDGMAWIDLPSTLQATTTMTGQAPGTVLHFRYRALTKAGQTDWSGPVTLTVPLPADAELIARAR